MYNTSIEGRQLCGFPPVACNNGPTFDIRVTNASLAFIPNAPGMRALLCVIWGLNRWALRAIIT